MKKRLESASRVTIVLWRHGAPPRSTVRLASVEPCRTSRNATPNLTTQQHQTFITTFSKQHTHSYITINMSSSRYYSKRDSRDVSPLVVEERSHSNKSSSTSLRMERSEKQFHLTMHKPCWIGRRNYKKSMNEKWIIWKENINENYPN